MDEARAPAIDELEAPHEAPEGEVRAAAPERVHRAASLRRRPERDLEAFSRQVAAVNRHELGSVEERAERLDDPQADGRHGGRSIRRRATEPGGLVEPRA